MDSIKCSICKEHFDSKTKLDNHRRVSHQKTVEVKLSSGNIVLKRNENGEFQCPQCQIMSKWAHSIKRHVGSCHSEIGQFKRVATIEPADMNQNGIFFVLLILKMN